MGNFETQDSLNSIAIIGMHCRFPGAAGVEAFWQNLKDGVESVSLFSDQELADSGVGRSLMIKPNYVRSGAVIPDVDLFDARFFDFSAREAEMLDPQHRLFLECAWEVFEGAGYDAEGYRGAVGVYAGTGMNMYLCNNLFANIDLTDPANVFQTMITSDKDFLSTKVSYKLNLKGPSITVQTACSTSLVAVHLACQGLLNGECDMALAGAVTVRTPQKIGYLYQEGGVLSPDGRCRAFDAKAQGMVGGNGVGIVALKRLEDALADGDTVYAVIKGTAINNDGSAKVGYTAPGVNGQAEAIAEAMAVAGVHPETVTYIEAHGTGTPLGDPIEIAALTQAFRAHTRKKAFCAIGSVKTNIGHLDTAAGIAGLIKTVLALQHRQIPPSLHFQQPNPQIDFANSPFYVNTKLSEWKSEGDAPRRAGVSSFGIGGTNAHVVLEEAPQREESGQSRPWQVVVVSAKSETALGRATENLANFLKNQIGVLDNYEAQTHVSGQVRGMKPVNLADVAYTLQVGRRGFPYRRMVVCKTAEEAGKSLNSLDPKKVFTGVQEAEEPPVVFLFSGQGAQYVDMGRELYETEPTFRQTMDRCDEILKHSLGKSLMGVMYPGCHATGNQKSEIRNPKLEIRSTKSEARNTKYETQGMLGETAYTQPALFALEYALAKLWMEWGIRPRAMIGHSIGEYVAACLAGVFSLEEALGLVATRGRLIQELPKGAMLAVSLSEEEVLEKLPEGLSLAAVNAPNLCVASGNTEIIEKLQKELEGQGTPCRLLHTSHAFHSAMMEGVLPPFMEQVRKVTLKPPQMPYISNVTGKWIMAGEATDPGYWAKHLRQTVRFSEGVQLLLKEPKNVLLEIGPGTTLCTLANRHLERGAKRVVVSSLPHPQEGKTDGESMATALGRLWLSGVKVDWQGYSRHERRHRLPMPTYPFERQRYWIEPGGSRPSANRKQLEKNPNRAEWFYVPSWKRAPMVVSEVFPPPYPLQGGIVPMPVSETSPVLKTCEVLGCWMVFVDGCGVGERLAKRLEEEGREVITVRAGQRYEKVNERAYMLNPGNRNDYDALFAELQRGNTIPGRIVHAWGVTGAEDGETGGEKLLELGYYSLLYLGQVLGRRNVSERFHVVVVTNGVQEVTGEEWLCPEKATALGPVKVLQQEHPNVRCRSVDVELGRGDGDKLTGYLLAECAADSDDTVVAYRGRRRWVQTFEPLRLEDTGKVPKLLREGGVYLITGGLGGIGLLLAEYLARTVKAKLILTGRSALPAREEWDRRLSPAGSAVPFNMPQDCYGHAAYGVPLDMEKESDYVNRLEEKIAGELGIRVIESYVGLKESLDALCASHIYGYLTANGTMDAEKGRKYSREGLKKKLRILPKFEKFYGFFLQILSDDAIIRVEGDTIEFLKSRDEVINPDTLKRRAEERYPEFKAMFGAFDHFVPYYRAALSGEIEAVSVLFPDGQAGPLQEVVKNTVEHTRHRQYMLMVKEILAKMLRESAGKKLRILEIGGGAGVLTKLIAPVLINQNVEYYFTDIGKSFVMKAEREAKESGLDFMKFGIFDISSDPARQGFEPHSFDMIVELDVVHATRSVLDTLWRLKELLAPNGVMFFVETVKSPRWSTMAYGLAEGWWYFEDGDFRCDSPLLSLEKWEAVFRKQGFERVRSYPQDNSKRQEADCGLIIAQMPGGTSMNGAPYWIAGNKKDETQRMRDRIRKLKELEALGSGLLALNADVSDPEQMRSVVNQAYQRFGKIHGVIHSAAIENRGPIQLKSPVPDRCEFDAKIKGTRVLDALFSDKNLDFMVLCSSHSAILSGVGDVEYCAANAFLDAFAHKQASVRGAPILSINWDRWENVGMASAYESMYKARTGEAPTGGMSPQEGANAFHRVLCGVPAPQVIVSTRDFNAMMRQGNIFVSREEPDKRTPSASLHSRPDLQTPFTPPEGEVEKAVAGIWQEALGIGRVGVHDNFSELGGDSLVAIKVIARLRESLGVDLTVRTLFEAPTVACLAERIETVRWAREGAPSAHPGGDIEHEEGAL